MVLGREGALMPGALRKRERPVSQATGQRDGDRTGEVMRPQRQAVAELEGFLEEGCFG